jgi:hypothetical protein
MNSENLCPFLGMRDDPATSLSFASEGNCCFRFKPAEDIRPGHQEAFCLTPNYKVCPIYQGSIDRKLISFEYEPGKSYQKKKPPINWLMVLIIGILAVLLISAVVLAFTSGLLNGLPALASAPTASIVPATIQPTPIPTIAPSKTPPASPTATESPMPTSTPEPSATTAQTSGITSSPTSEKTVTPAAKKDKKYTVHQVLPGEGLTYLAGKFNTSESAIKAVNYYLPTPLWLDWLMIIPVGITDPQGLPSLAVYVNYSEGISLSDLAKKLGLDVSLLVDVNEMQSTDKLKYEQRLIIPKAKATPTR